MANLRSGFRCLAARAVCLALGAFLFGAGVFEARAQSAQEAAPVDVELVLAVDISYSMDPEEQRLQREGYIKALRSPEFQQALASGLYRKIALTYFQWAGAHDQDVLLPWTLIDGPESANAVADKLAEAPYRRARRTSISGAIDSSVRLFDNNGFSGLRRVIDISGDGPNNDGRLVVEARDEALKQGFIINGLPLMLRPSSWGFSDIANLDHYFEDCVIGGPGSFVIPIRDRSEFVNATRTKLVMEIAAPARLPAIQAGFGDTAPRLILAQAQRSAPRIDCQIGEIMWRQRWGVPAE